LAQGLQRELRRSRVRAVFVPFDSVPETRLLVRSAQAMGIPSFVINDGFKADDVQVDGLTADVALAWSVALRDHYFSRRPRGRTIVTGNPRLDAHPTRKPRSHGRVTPATIVVGGFAFSPVDLNCRRSDPELFLDGVLEGVGRARGLDSSTVVVKLHPADEPTHYTDVLAAHSGLDIQLLTSGDVVDLFQECDLYVTSASTSLLEAVAIGVPVIYYRVNWQRFHPPFEGDDYLSRRTASSPSELGTLVRAGELLGEQPPEGWIERYLGPRDGRSVARIVDAIDSFASPDEARPFGC
jgi:hypothetical protein